MQNQIPEPVFLSAPKAATLCGVSRNTICCWIRDGKLPSYRTAGGKYLIRPGDLINFMKDNQMFVPPALVEIASNDEKNQKTEPVPDGKRETGQEPAILIVDDDPVTRDLIQRALHPLGLPLIQSEDGYHALHQLTQNSLIALVILDLMMPGQNGAKTLVEIRKNFPAVPVIVCTGQNMEHAETLLAEEKPDLIITKPFESEYLLKTASTYLSDLGF